MSSDLPDETVIREYLLGTLPEQDWEKIEEKLLSDKEFADFVDCIEDEIIEEYLAIHNHFLRPPERQRKLLFASTLHSKLKKEQHKEQQAAVPIDLPRRLQPARTSRPYWAAAIAAAAVLLLSTAPLGVYIASLHSDLKVAKARTNNAESMLAQANQQVASLQHEVGDRNKPNVVTPYLINRGAAAQPHVFPSKTGSVEIQIPLDGPISPPYEVKLRVGDAGGQVLWWQNNLQPTDSGILDFRIPYYGPGHYFVDVFRRGPPSSTSLKTYSFSTEQATH